LKHKLIKQQLAACEIHKRAVTVIVSCMTSSSERIVHSTNLCAEKADFKVEIENSIK